MMMDKVRYKETPETKVRDAIIKMMRYKGWYVKIMHGSIFQSGFPDLYCTHADYRVRLIEVKLPEMKGSKFTGAQMRDFPLLIAHGSPVWVLTAGTEEEYAKLFKPCNFHEYLHIFRV